MSAKLEETSQGAIALAFGSAIAAGDFEHAHFLLSASLQTTTSPQQLAQDFDAMISYLDYVPETPPNVEVISLLEDWPNKKSEEMGYVYVGLFNDDYCEAVYVLVAKEQGRIVIRSIEWGRP